MVKADDGNTTRRGALHVIAGGAVAASTVGAMAVIGADAQLIAMCRQWADLNARWLAAAQEDDEAAADEAFRQERAMHAAIVDTPATTIEGIIAKATVLAHWFDDAADDLAKPEDERVFWSSDDLICGSIARDIRSLSQRGVI